MGGLNGIPSSWAEKSRDGKCKGVGGISLFAPVAAGGPASKTLRRQKGFSHCGSVAAQRPAAPRPQKACGPVASNASCSPMLPPLTSLHVPCCFVGLVGFFQPSGVPLSFVAHWKAKKEQQPPWHKGGDCTIQASHKSTGD